MTDSDLRRLLGLPDDDAGCDAAFGVFDEYCDAVRRGDPAADIAARYADFLTHVANCRPVGRTSRASWPFSGTRSRDGGKISRHRAANTEEG